MKSRPDISIRFELVNNRLKYLTDAIIEIEKERDILCAELQALNNLKELYDNHPDDIIDREREAVDYLDTYSAKKTEPSNRMCGRKIKSPLRDSIVAAIEDFGPLNSMELIETIKGHTPNSIRNTIMRMAREGALKRPDRKGGSYRLP